VKNFIGLLQELDLHEPRSFSDIKNRLALTSAQLSRTLEYPLNEHFVEKHNGLYVLGKKSTALARSVLGHQYSGSRVEKCMKAICRESGVSCAYMTLQKDFFQYEVVCPADYGFSFMPVFTSNTRFARNPFVHVLLARLPQSEMLRYYLLDNQRKNNFASFERFQRYLSGVKKRGVYISKRGRPVTSVAVPIVKNAGTEKEVCRSAIAIALLGSSYNEDFLNKVIRIVEKNRKKYKV
jgi:DNA-binding IclR family transcriptional regulator